MSKIIHNQYDNKPVSDIDTITLNLMLEFLINESKILDLEIENIKEEIRKR